MTSSQNDGCPGDALEILLSKRRSVRSYGSGPVGLRAVHRILAAAQGVSPADGKRTAPSAHALYPLQLFLVARRVDGLDRGIHAYGAEDRSLRRSGAEPAPGVLVSTSLADDTWLEESAAIVIVGARIDEAIRYFAEQQSDGRRGVRYVDFEAGACVQNMYLTVSAEGLGGVVVMGFDDDRMKTALKLPDDIVPIALFCIGPMADAV